MRVLDPRPAFEQSVPMLQRSKRAICPYCHHESRPYLRAKDYNQRISSETFQYYSCSDCGLVYLFPIPRDLGRYYGRNYGPYHVPSAARELSLEAEKVRFRIQMVQKFVRTGRLLEIGPSFGAFAFLAKKAGFEVDTIEMDDRCFRFLRDVVGVNCIHTSDVMLALEGAPGYDVIALWHNIEHLPDPFTVLRRLAELLLPGGILIMSTPNPESLQFRVFRRFWVNLDAPRHLELIPASLLRRFMSTCGLTALWSTTRDQEGLMLNRCGWRSSFLHVLTSLREFRGRRSPRFELVDTTTEGARGRLLAPLLRAVVTGLLNRLEMMDWRGSAYTIVFRQSV